MVVTLKRKKPFRSEDEMPPASFAICTKDAENVILNIYTRYVFPSPALFISRRGIASKLFIGGLRWIGVDRLDIKQHSREGSIPNLSLPHILLCEHQRQGWRLVDDVKSAYFQLALRSLRSLGEKKNNDQSPIYVP